MMKKFGNGVDGGDIPVELGGVSKTKSIPKSIYDNVAYGPRLYGIRTEMIG